jgi:hypothetical protein
MDETSDEEEAPGPAASGSVQSRSQGLAGVGSTLGASALGLDSPVEANDDTRDMSVSTLHLYDLHLSQVSTLSRHASLIAEINNLS